MYMDTVHHLMGKKEKKKNQIHNENMYIQQKKTLTQQTITKPVAC